MRIGFIVLAIFAGLAGAVGDALLSHWAKKSAPWGWLVGGILVWNVALVPFIFMLKRGLLAECVIAFLLANSLLIIGISVVVLREEISLNKWLWMLLGLLALVMMQKE